MINEEDPFLKSLYFSINQELDPPTEAAAKKNISDYLVAGKLNEIIG